MLLPGVREGEQGVACRLIVRRTKPTPGSQLALLVDYSYHAFITDLTVPKVPLDVDHRRHAVVENAIRDLKYGVGAQPSALRALRGQRGVACPQRDRPQHVPLDRPHRRA